MVDLLAEAEAEVRQLDADMSQKRSAKDAVGGAHGKEGARKWAVGCDRQRSDWAKVLTWQPITVKRRDPKLDPRHRNESVWVNPGVYKTLTIES